MQLQVQSPFTERSLLHVVHPLLGYDPLQFQSLFEQRARDDYVQNRVAEDAENLLVFALSLVIVPPLRVGLASEGTPQSLLVLEMVSQTVFQLRDVFAYLNSPLALARHRVKSNLTLSAFMREGWASEPTRRSPERGARTTTSRRVFPKEAGPRGKDHVFRTHPSPR